MPDEIDNKDEKLDDNKDEKIVDDKKVDDKEDEEEVDPEQEEKDNLWALLKNPKTAKSVIQSLAEEAGLLGDKKTDKQIKNSVIETLEEELGDDFKFLGPRIGKALERILAQRDEKTEERFREHGQKEIQRETDSAVEKIKGEFKDFSLFENKIVKLMKEIAPSNNLSQYSYLKRLYTLAKAESSSSTRGTETKKRDGVLSKLNSKPPVGGEHKEPSSRPLSRRAAIEEAFEELSSKE